MCVVYSVYICWKSSEKDWENLGLAIASNLLVKTEPGSRFALRNLLPRVGIPLEPFALRRVAQPADEGRDTFGWAVARWTQCIQAAPPRARNAVKPVSVHAA